MPPRRTCVGCRTRRDALELTRCTLSAGESSSDDDTAVADVTVGGPSSGRGAWICRSSTACLAQALRRKAFDRAWRHPLPSQAAESLLRAFEADASNVKELPVAPTPVPAQASWLDTPTKG